MWCLVLCRRMHHSQGRFPQCIGHGEFWNRPGGNPELFTNLSTSSVKKLAPNPYVLYVSQRFPHYDQFGISPLDPSQLRPSVRMLQRIERRCSWQFHCEGPCSSGAARGPPGSVGGNLDFENVLSVSKQ